MGYQTAVECKEEFTVSIRGVYTIHWVQNVLMVFVPPLICHPEVPSGQTQRGKH